MHNHHNYHNNHNGQIRDIRFQNGNTSSIAMENEQQTTTVPTNTNTNNNNTMGVNVTQHQTTVPQNTAINVKMQGQVQRNRLPCIHKGTTKCTLKDTNRCCACMDPRPHEPSYTKDVDGVGTVSNATRWDFYCPGCKSFWEDAISRSGVAPQDTKIPHYPTHTRKAITPQNSGLSAMLASGNNSANASPVNSIAASPMKLQSPLSTSSGNGKPVLSKLTIPQSTRPMPVLTVHYKTGQQDQQQQQQQQQQTQPAQPTGQKRPAEDEQQPVHFANPFRPVHRANPLAGTRSVADLVARSRMVHRAVQQNYPRPIVHQTLQPPLLGARRSAGADYPSPTSSLSRGNSDYYSNEEPESASAFGSDNDDDDDDDADSYAGEDVAREAETFQTQRNHTRLATRALVRGDFAAAEAHFATAYAIASSSRWKSSSRSDRVALAIKMAEAQSSQGNYDRAMRTLEAACEVAEEMSTNEHYYKVQLAMSEVGFKVADAAEKRRKRVMKSVEEEYGRGSELWREGNRIGQFANFSAIAGRGQEDTGEPARKRVNVSGMVRDLRDKAKSDLGTVSMVKSEPVDVDEEKGWNAVGNPSTRVLEAMA